MHIGLTKCIRDPDCTMCPDGEVFDAVCPPEIRVIVPGVSGIACRGSAVTGMSCPPIPVNHTITASWPAINAVLTRHDDPPPWYLHWNTGWIPGEAEFYCCANGNTQVGDVRRAVGFTCTTVTSGPDAGMSAWVVIVDHFVRNANPGGTDPPSIHLGSAFYRVPATCACPYFGDYPLEQAALFMGEHSSCDGDQCTEHTGNPFPESIQVSPP